jgi:hypothetical protein
LKVAQHGSALYFAPNPMLGRLAKQPESPQGTAESFCLNSIGRQQFLEFIGKNPALLS